MDRYLVELTGDQLDRLNGMVREAIIRYRGRKQRRTGRPAYGFA